MHFRKIGFAFFSDFLIIEDEMCQKEGRVSWFDPD